MNSAIEQLCNNKAITNAFGLKENSAVNGTYGFSNENLRQYIRLLNIAGGRVATVGSSGDQALYSVFCDAEEVTLIDANPYTKPMVELKMSAITNMSLDEFRKYWTYDSVLNQSMYNDLLVDVSRDTRDFLAEYQKLYENRQKVDVPEISKKATFNYSEHYRNGAIYYSPYDLPDVIEFFEDEGKYRELQSKLQNAKIRFDVAELKDFPKKLKGKYSNIMLSNVYDYYSSKKSFFDIVTRLIDKNMRKGSTMQMQYKLLGYDYLCEDMIAKRLKSGNVSRYVVQSPSEMIMNTIRKRNSGYKYASNGPLIEEDTYPREVDKDEIARVGENFVYIYEK